MKIRLNDTVIVTAGKDKGKTGEVTRLLKKENRLVVQGVNECKKNIKPKGEQPGQQITFFASIDVSNVALIDPKSGKATRIRYQVEGKTKSRIAVASGEVIERKDTKTSAKKK